jgi:eukaryotic-like serine/threonine-protein kinase
MTTPTTLLADRYRLVKMLGAGGMGIVWQAWDERLRRPVALKMLRTQPQLTDTERQAATDRAMREARITAGLHHPHAVTVFDVIEHEGQPCIVMQLIESTPLSDLLREHGPLSPAETARIGEQVASALAAAHKMKIVHRDVKPGNILITEDGSAMISDFGISHALGDATITATGMIHGTPAYLAPEAARGLPTTFASDVFSLGSTFYAMVEGEPPFGSDKNAIALLHRVAQGGYPAPKHAGPLAPLLWEMLFPQPKRRPSMASVVQSLSEARERARGWPAAAAGTVAASVVPPELVATQPLADDDATAAEQPPTRTTIPLHGAAAASAAPPRPAPPLPPPAPATQTPLPEGEREGGATAETARMHDTTREDGVTAETEPLTGAAAAVVAAPPPATREPPAAADPAPERRDRRRTGVVAALVLVVALVVAAALLFIFLPPAADPDAGPVNEATPTQTPAEAEPTPTPEEEAAAPPAEEAPPEEQEPAPPAQTAEQRATEAVSSYYTLLPGDLDTAWPRMTADYQENHAGGRGGYEAFWAEIAGVEVADVVAAAPDQVQATLTYYYQDGRVVQEVTSYRLVDEGGVLKIAASDVLSSAEL